MKMYCNTKKKGFRTMIAALIFHHYSSAHVRAQIVYDIKAGQDDWLLIWLNGACGTMTRLCK